VKALITRKIGMTSTINEAGVVEAITLLAVNDNVITQIKNSEIDGYSAVQIGFESDKNIAKAQVGHAKNAKATPKHFREFKITDGEEELTVGDKINVESFELGDKIDVTDISKGKGWAGTIKRHNFHRQRKTHGGKGNTRKPGSIGSMYPQKVFKGKKMAGQLGYVRTTVKNLKVALINTELKVIGVTGAVPGPRKGIVIIKGVK